MQTICTIITPDYIQFAKVLHNSLKMFDSTITLHVLVLGDVDKQLNSNLIILPLKTIIENSLAKDLEIKYAYINSDYFRWALKPLLISYLLEEGFTKVIYTDPDIFFVNDFNFLFTQLDNSAVLLTPHWRDTNPLKNEDNFIALFKDGLYNAGFIGVSTSGLEPIKWWAGLCHYKMGESEEKGIYVDQRYLDAMPIKFSNICILKHQGCNIAKWNINECKRELNNGNILINGKYPVIFIHFTHETIQEILNGNDQLLQPYLEQYKIALEKEGINFSEYIDAKNKIFIQVVKERTLIRTRIKRFFYKLAQRL